MSSKEMTPTDMAVQMLANSNGDKSSGKGRNWYETMAEAWGQTLNNHANGMIDRAEAIGTGDDSPMNLTMFSAEAMRMNVLSQSAHSAVTTLGSALETMARKQ